MNEAIGQIQGSQLMAAQREHSKTIVASEAQRLEKRALAFRFIEQAIEALNPDKPTEEALWELLCQFRAMNINRY